MGESNREELEKSILGESGVEDCVVQYGEDFNGTPKVTDGWVLPVTEVLRIQKARDEILESEISFYSEDSLSTPINPLQLRYVNPVVPFITRTHVFD
jgi:midasin